MADSKIFSCLIIDDWDSMHIILTDLLKPHRRVRVVGHCFNTLDAIEMIHKKKPDFIFLDIENAPYTGPEMLTKIPAQDFKVIIVTADPMLLSAPPDPRIVAVLPKFVDPAELRKALSGIISHG